MTVDRHAVTRIARLARIEIPDNELDPLAKELSNILVWVEQLGELDTRGVAPMTNLMSSGSRWREDVVDDGGIPRDVVANAPEISRNMFCVPKVVE